MRALYAFCRISDDLVDSPNGNARQELETWRWQSFYYPDGRENLRTTNLVTLAWSDTRLRYNIPMAYEEQLIDGVGRDITQKRYQSFEDLASYCYGVASTAGLMAMHIIGFTIEANDYDVFSRRAHVTTWQKIKKLPGIWVKHSKM